MTSVNGGGWVEFRFYRPRVQGVRVVGAFDGDWCGWEELAEGPPAPSNPDIFPLIDLPMRPDGDGWWTAVARLGPGDYKFHYEADGQWYADYAANGLERDDAGWNSILVVPGSADLAATELKAVALARPEGDADRKRNNAARMVA